MLLAAALSAAVFAIPSLSDEAPGARPKSGCDRFASPNGSDRASGTAARPFRTPARLVAALRPGDRGCLRRGTYYGPLRIHRGGRAGRRLVLRAFRSERVRFVGRLWLDAAADYVTIRGLHLDGTNSLRLPSPTVNAQHARFVGNDVTNARSGICFSLGHERYGIAEDVAIVRNRIHDCGRLPPTNHEHGVYLSMARRTLLEGNWIYRNADRGIQLSPDAQDTLVRGNVINANGQGIIFSGAGAVSSGGTLVQGNVISNSLVRHNVESFYPAGTPIGSGNLVEGNCIGGGVRDDGNGGIAQAVGFSVGRNMIAAPRFRRWDGADLRLARGDRCAAMLQANPRSIPGPPRRR